MIKTEDITRLIDEAHISGQASIEIILLVLRSELVLGGDTKGLFDLAAVCIEYGRKRACEHAAELALLEATENN